MRFAFIAKNRGTWQVRQLCEALGVSRGGFYEWLARPESQRSKDNQALTQQIHKSFQLSDRTYGSIRVTRDLHDWGFGCGHNRVARLMLVAGLKARHKRRRLPTDQGERPECSIAPNLLDRTFEATAPNQRWVADFTYIWTAQGWLYCAVVLDLFSRRIVGWSMSEQMTAQLVTDALIMALWRRGKPQQLLHHSDQGSQYTSVAFGFRCKEAGVRPSTAMPTTTPWPRLSSPPLGARCWTAAASAPRPWRGWRCSPIHGRDQWLCGHRATAPVSAASPWRKRRR